MLRQDTNAGVSVLDIFDGLRFGFQALALDAGLFDGVSRYRLLLDRSFSSRIDTRQWVDGKDLIREFGRERLAGLKNRSGNFVGNLLSCLRSVLSVGYTLNWKLGIAPLRKLAFLGSFGLLFQVLVALFALGLFIFSLSISVSQTI